MRAAPWSVTAATTLAVLCLVQDPDASAAGYRQALHMPWQEAGLTETQAASHLVNRFTFGPRPGQLEEVMGAGLERWFERQLAGNAPDPNLEARLRDMPALRLSEADIVRVYPPHNAVLAEARKAGLVSKELVESAQAENKAQSSAKSPNPNSNSNPNPNPGPNPGPSAGPSTGKSGGPGAAKGAASGPAGPAGPGAAAEESGPKRELRERLAEFSRARGYKPEQELIEQLYAQKVYRAADSQNQLAEVMTDFWFNHFNVSLTNGRTRPYLLSYERDAIRAHALGRVRELLEATARHPAMLVYLDNAESTANPDAPTLLPEMPAQQPRRYAFQPGPFGYRWRRPPPPPPRPQQKKPAHGLNENYARELMELHTLGVDGGYTQQDVIEVARAFTGWTVIPAGPAREGIEKRLERAQQFGGLGFHVEGDFLFRPDMHDSGPKVVLGRRLPGGRGMADGETVLDLLAYHPATARHLATQLAVRFVSDKPPQPLVDRLTMAYVQSGGDTREVLRAMVESKEFWSKEAIGAKIKSPFELAISAVRASGAHVEEPRALLAWIGRMGQPLYAYQAPTGYPDRAESWVNTGSLLNRMNFGLQFAAARVQGVDLDLPSLYEGREPESVQDALRTYAGLLMPGRNLDSTVKLLTPMVADPRLWQRLDAALPAAAAAAAPVAAASASARAAASAGAKPGAPAAAGPRSGLAVGDAMSGGTMGPQPAISEVGAEMRAGMGPETTPAIVPAMAPEMTSTQLERDPRRPRKGDNHPLPDAAAARREPAAAGGRSQPAALASQSGAGRPNPNPSPAQRPREPTPLEQVVGVILGSPEFQRR